MADHKVKATEKDAPVPVVETPPPADLPIPVAAPKSFAQVRAEREMSGEASNASSTAYPESQPEAGKAKPSARVQKEMDAGSKAVKARGAEQGGGT